MKVQDMGLLVIAGLAIMTSLHGEGMFVLKKHWVEVVDQTLFNNGVYASDSEHIPRPIVADLDGDGQQDIIVVTREPKIKILDTDSPVAYFEGEDEVDVFPVKAEASLLSSVLVNTGRQAVAVETGYLDGFNGSPAKQVIVVVLQEWTVLLFDHQLNLLWETQLQDEVGEITHNKMWREVSIVITDQPVHRHDKGAIIVGGRLVASSDHVEAAGMHDEYETHFTMVALDGERAGFTTRITAKEYPTGDRLMLYSRKERSGVRLLRHASALMGGATVNAPGPPMQWNLAVGMYTDMDAEKAHRMLNDWEYRRTWDSHCLVAEVAESRGEGDQVVHQVVKLPYPFMDREYVFCRSEKLNVAEGVHVHMHEQITHEQFPPSNRTVRVSRFEQCIVLRQRGPHTEILTLTVQESGLRIPPQISRWVAQSAFPAFFTSTRDALHNYKENL